MNAVGRQRSGASGAHHQRQHSDNFLETSSSRRWLQSAGLQHLQSSNNDFGYYNQGSRMCRSVQGQRTYGGGSHFLSEPLTPPGNPRQIKNGEEPVSLNEYSPGLLDLHSFDTELLSENQDRNGRYGRSTTGTPPTLMKFRAVNVYALGRLYVY